MFSHSPSWRWHLATIVLIIVCVGGRLFYLTTNAAPDLAPDEAHYWDWSRHLDWSYYSKGPLVAWLIRASCELFGTSPLAVRVPALLCGGLLSGGIYLLTLRSFGSARLGFVTVAVFATLPALNVGGILITIDAPFTCCWCWALVFGQWAMLDRRRWAWPAAGVMIALGILAKYTMLLWVGSAFLFLALTPSLRNELFRPGFWVMCLIAALGGLPILWWNASNDWVSFAHVGTQAGVSDDIALRWAGPFEYLAGQSFMMLGFWFFCWLAALWSWRQHPEPAIRYLWWMSLPTFLIFLCFSANTKVQLNWPITAYLSGGVLTVGWIVTKMDQFSPGTSRSRRVWVWTTTSACILGIAVTVLVFEIRLIRPVLVAAAGESTETQPLPLRKIDPTCRLRGWQHLASEIDAIRTDLAQRGIHDPVIVGNRWILPGEVGFYCFGHPQAFTIGPYLGDRHSQYDLWRPNPLDDADFFRGRTFIYVGLNEIAALQPGFDRIEPYRPVHYQEEGQSLARWNIWICHGFRGLPRLSGQADRATRY